MLRNVAQLKGFSLRTKDGEIGTVDQFYFDDQTWAIRYLVVNTGTWLLDRLVLISPHAINQTDFAARQFGVALTKKQVEGSPNINKHKPVSRQHETDYMKYYGYPLYWSGPYLWGTMAYPTGYAIPSAVAMGASTARTPDGEVADTHLRSTAEVTDYHLEATDGEIGHVVDFLFDEQTWAIQYIEASTRNWWPGKKVLFSPQWVNRVSWSDSKLYVDLSRDAIKSGPEYVDSVPITRTYENALWSHYRRSGYWQDKVVQPKFHTANQD